MPSCTWWKTLLGPPSEGGRYECFWSWSVHYGFCPSTRRCRPYRLFEGSRLRVLEWFVNRLHSGREGGGARLFEGVVIDVVRDSSIVLWLIDRQRRNGSSNHNVRHAWLHNCR